MKKIVLSAFVAFAGILATSCSSSDGDGGTDATEYFNYTENGTDMGVTQWEAYRSQESFEAMGSRTDGTSIYFDFDQYGNLGRATSTPANVSSDPWMSSIYDNSENDFDFDVVAIDEANHMIKVNYSGKLYEDDFDYTSPFNTVSGSFNIHYQDLTPIIPDLRFAAKINGVDWYSTKFVTTSFGSDVVDLEFNSDDRNELDLSFDEYLTTPGTYSFTPSSATNKVTYKKYNQATHEYVEYACTGTLTITQNLNDGGPGVDIIAGTFNLTAVNGSETIQVTSGTFKTNY